MRDTWINCRDMWIQYFLNFGDICHIYFRDMAYFFKIIKGIWDTGTPFQGLSYARTYNIIQTFREKIHVKPLSKSLAWDLLDM